MSTNPNHPPMTVKVVKVMPGATIRRTGAATGGGRYLIFGNGRLWGNCRW